MGQNSDVFLRMSEEHYMQIPNEIREMFLSAKRVDEANALVSATITKEIGKKI